MTRHGLPDLLLGVWLWVLASCLPAGVLGQANYATPYTFITLAGNSGNGSADGTNSAARFASPYGAAVDANGNVYVADTSNHTIRKMTPVGTNWVVTTLAGLAGVTGSADGTGSAARFNAPGDVTVDSGGNLYVAEYGNGTIRKVTPVGTNWVVTTLAGLAGNPGSADGTNSVARFYGPISVAVDSATNLYVADFRNDTIRKVTPVGTNWVVTTIAGLAGNVGSQGGVGSAARFNLPAGVAVDSATNVYVADYGNDTIRKVTQVLTGFWSVTTLVGLAGSSGTNNGTGSAARFNGPAGVAVDSATNLYVGDWSNYTIRKVTPVGANWVVTTLAGLGGTSGSVDGTNSAARFYLPNGVAVDSATNIYVPDCGNSTIREVAPVGANWVVTTLAGLAMGSVGSADGTGSAARFNSPEGVAVDSAANLYVADQNNDTIRQVTPAGVVTTLAGQAGVSGSLNGTGSNARFNGPWGVAVGTDGSVYVGDGNNNTIRQVTPVGTNWVVTTIAGEAGIAGYANGSPGQLNDPLGVAVDSAGNVYVGDSSSQTIRKVTLVEGNWVVTTIAGAAYKSGSADGTGSVARFYNPAGVAVDSAGNLYVADSYNYTIRKVTLVEGNWVVTTLAGLAGKAGSADGTNSTARFYYPWSVAVDTNSNVFVTDSGNETIRKVTPVGTNWVVTTIAGVTNEGDGEDGTGSAAQFWYPDGVAVDTNGNVYVTDASYNTIRKGFPASSVPAPMLQPPSLSAGQFGFGITGLPNLALDIESSGDLSQWQVVGTYILAGGTNYFVSPNPSLGAQFYRGHVR
jgi:hypothetical protein